MNLENFNKLNTAQKADLVWDWGYFISNNNYGDYTVALFYMNGYFAKLKISKSDNKTESVIGFSREQLHSDFPKAIETNSLFVKEKF